jgi:hypothetical protein
VPENVRDAVPLILLVAILGGIATYVVLRRVGRRAEIALLVGCGLAILGSTQVASEQRPPSENPFSVSGVWRAATWWADRPDVFPLLTTERLLNVLVFVPVGYLLQRVTRSGTRSLVVVAGFSFTIECGQAATRGRVADAVDVALNTTGGVLGIAAAMAAGEVASSRLRR